MDKEGRNKAERLVRHLCVLEAAHATNVLKGAR